MNRLLKRQNVPLLCDPTGLSAAWIDPTGVVHDLHAMGRQREEAEETFLPQDHEEWAELFLGTSAAAEAAERGDILDYVEELVKCGWIKVSNATSIDASNATSGAKASFARMLSKCVADGHIDPFEEIYIWTGDGSMILGSADLVEQWGSREMSEAMFAKLNARLEGRLSEARALRTLRGLVRALLT
jgi:hypothetical protein